jgi:hypothetical protein
MSIEVMRQALEVLEQINQLSIGENAIALPGEIDAAMDALDAAIEHYDQTSLELCNECGWRALIPGEGCLTCARQKAQPVAWMHVQGNYEEPSLRQLDDFELDRGWEQYPLYTAPRQWVGLTEDELKLLWEQYGYKSAMCKPFAHAIEAKLKEKNA